MNAVIASAPPISYREAYKSVSDDIHQAYASFGQRISDSGWAIGKLCLVTIRAGVPAMYAYRIAANDTGLSARTVRLYCQVLRDFDDATIEEYSSAGFGITHFVAASQAADPVAALCWARDSADDWGGKIASVDMILARWVLPDGPPVPEDPPPPVAGPAWVGVLRSAGSALAGDSRTLFDQGLALILQAFGIK